MMSKCIKLVVTMKQLNQLLVGHASLSCSSDPNTLKEYRKRNASGAVCDDPRIAVGPGVLTEL